MRLITIISVPWIALALFGCSAADSTSPNGTSNCMDGQCGGGSTSGDPSGSGGASSSGNAVGSGTGAGGTGAGGTGGAPTGGAGGTGGAPVDPCIELLAVLEEAQSAAQECVPGSDMPQCQVFIDGICCSIAVNDNQIAIQTYQAALEEVQQANCPCPLPPPVDCQANPTASCVPDGENTGHCVIDPP